MTLSKERMRQYQSDRRKKLKNVNTDDPDIMEYSFPYEKILSLRTPSIPLSIAESCVYFLFQGGEVIYIGKTRNILLRVSEHSSRFDKAFDSVAILPVDKDRLSSVELFYIRSFSPRYNVAGKLPADIQIGIAGSHFGKQLSELRAEMEVLRNQLATLRIEVDSLKGAVGSAARVAEKVTSVGVGKAVKAPADLFARVVAEKEARLGRG